MALEAFSFSFSLQFWLHAAKGVSTGSWKVENVVSTDYSVVILLNHQIDRHRIFDIKAFWSKEVQLLFLNCNTKWWFLMWYIPVFCRTIILVLSFHQFVKRYGSSFLLGPKELQTVVQLFLPGCMLLLAGDKGSFGKRCNWSFPIGVQRWWIVIIVI